MMLSKNLPLLASQACQIKPGQALTLRRPQAGVLRIQQGQIWATVQGPHSGAANDWGDRVLKAGEWLALPACRAVVVEPWPQGAAPAGAVFKWEPAGGAPDAALRLEPGQASGLGLSLRWNLARAWAAVRRLMPRAVTN